jgi:hypothetical protein
MCSEAVWWRCHRRIVADHLIARGESVFHLMGRDRIEPAKLTAGARLQASGAVTYPARPDEPEHARGSNERRGERPRDHAEGSAEHRE